MSSTHCNSKLRNCFILKANNTLKISLLSSWLYISLNYNFCDVFRILINIFRLLLLSIIVVYGFRHDLHHHDYKVTWYFKNHYCQVNFIHLKKKIYKHNNKIIRPLNVIGNHYLLSQLKYIEILALTASYIQMTFPL